MIVQCFLLLAAFYNKQHNKNVSRRDFLFKGTTVLRLILRK